MKIGIASLDAYKARSFAIARVRLSAGIRIGDLRQHQRDYFLRKSAFIATEACDHGSQELFWDDRTVVYFVAGKMPKQRKKCELRPAVAFTKWMNGVKLA